ncbi:acyltransferase domain-containing protein [Streptomyces sp. NBC_01166]|uniref:acyltransferase domain-containing protein n=1 Tax=Streptomyces sp. NBC_01166 TaxID=2903755 RepID=UPI003868FD00|nr:acyltransferase domain-containing protein [Streptomyces sp. NBC_01166]
MPVPRDTGAPQAPLRSGGERGPRGLPTVFMFSGQGSQYHHMGRELFEADAVFRAALLRYDAVVVDESGSSVLDRVFDPARRKTDPFTDTRFTHPAIVMFQLALAEAVRAAGIPVRSVLGSSLGEYAAAAVAGAIEPADCLRLLVRQAALVHARVPGGMLAVLADMTVFDDAPALHGTDVAARNYPGHLVVAGRTDVLDRAAAQLRAAGVLHQPVPVEHGFHSYLMDDVRETFHDCFEGVTLTAPVIPWYSCVDGRPVTRPTAGHFWRVARRPIEFESTMRAMQERGDFLYLDLGPSGTLQGFARNNLAEGTRSRALGLLSPFGGGRDALAKARAALGGPG